MTSNTDGAAQAEWRDGGVVDLTKDGGALLFRYLVERKTDSAWPVAVFRTVDDCLTALADHRKARMVDSALKHTLSWLEWCDLPGANELRDEVAAALLEVVK